MPISATCQKCGATLPVPDEFAGKSVRCGGCQSVVIVPQKAAPLPTGVPVAQAVKARPVAIPVARKVAAAASVEPPLRKARKVRDEEEPEPWTAPPSRLRKDPPIVGPVPSSLELHPRPHARDAGSPPRPGHGLAGGGGNALLSFCNARRPDPERRRLPKACSSRRFDRRRV